MSSKSVARSKAFRVRRVFHSSCVISLLCVATLILLAAPSWANVLILSSNVERLQPGAELRDGDTLWLNSGERLRVYLPSGSTQMLEGPYAGKVNHLDRGQNLLISLWERVRQFVRTGGAKTDPRLPLNV